MAYTATHNLLWHDGVVLDLPNEEVTHNDVPVKIQGISFNILSTLMENIGHTFSPKELYDLSQGRMAFRDYDPTFTMYNHVRLINSRLGKPVITRARKGELIIHPQKITKIEHHRYKPKESRYLGTAKTSAVSILKIA